MTPQQRITVIKQRLQDAFQPTQLDVIDDSAKHVGHAGSRDGAGHYTVVIAAASFQHKTRIAIHREIYQVLTDLIPHDIHALQIRVIAK